MSVALNLNKVCIPPFDQIFHKYRSGLTYYAWRLLNDQLAAEDIAAEVFIKYYQKESAFINEAAAKSFLIISTRNACLNYLRHVRHKSKREKSFMYSLEQNEDFALNGMTRKELIDEALNIIDGLPPECRRVIILGYVNNIRNKKVAQLLNVSVHTVKNHKDRGLKLIRAKYKKLERIVR